MISLGPWLLFDFPPSTPSRAENQQQPRSQGNHLSAPYGIITGEAEGRASSSSTRGNFSYWAARPGPARPDPTRPDPTRPDPTVTLFRSLYLWNRAFDRRAVFFAGQFHLLNNDWAQYRYIWMATIERGACRLRGVTKNLACCNSVPARSIVLKFGMHLGAVRLGVRGVDRCLPPSLPFPLKK